MNGYARLSDIQGDIAGVGTTDLVDELLRVRDEVSREFDTETRRVFYTTTATRVFDGDGRRLLLLGDDLISVTTLKVADDQEEADAGTFATTLTAGTDYQLWPRNAAGKGEPYRGIQLTQNGELNVFPVGEGMVQIVGKWGYNETWQDTGLTGTLDSTSDLTLTMSASAVGVIDPGDVLTAEDEQIGEVASVSGTTVTIEAGGRGRNGTTAAAHSAVAIYVRRYPLDVENAVKERAVGKRWATQGGNAGAAMMMGEGTDTRASYARWMKVIRSYKNPATVL